MPSKRSYKGEILCCKTDSQFKNCSLEKKKQTRFEKKVSEYDQEILHTADESTAATEQ